MYMYIGLYDMLKTIHKRVSFKGLKYSNIDIDLYNGEIVKLN